MTQQESPNSRPKLSGLAVTSFIVSFLAFFMSVYAGVPAILMGVLALYLIRKNPHVLAGEGYARWGVMLSVVGIVVTTVLYPMMFWNRNNVHGYSRSACAANIKGILTSMTVYANENNDCLPICAPPKEIFKYDVKWGINTRETLASKALEHMQSPALTGNINGPLWVMVLTQQVSPKSYLCKSDPFAASQAAMPANKANEYFAMFSKGDQLSYSIAYPWAKDDKTGVIGPASYWRNSTDGSIPLMSDMTPLSGTGKPKRDPRLADLADKRDFKAASSLNHNAEGQNIGFTDAHVEWSRGPNVGQHEDNIYTSGGKIDDPRRITQAPRPGEIEPILTRDSPYDTVMVPLRDGKTGAVK